MEDSVWFDKDLFLNSWKLNKMQVKYRMGQTPGVNKVKEKRPGFIPFIYSASKALFKELRCTWLK